MKFLVIDPRECATRYRSHDDPNQALRRYTPLEPGKTDHGTISKGLGIIVGEYGLYEPAEQQSYFAIAGRLYAGPAMLYAYNELGVTISLERPMLPPIKWLKTAADVETAIQAREVERPIVAVDGVLVWSWPQPKPDFKAAQDAIAERIKAGESVLIDGDTLISGVKP